MFVVFFRLKVSVQKLTEQKKSKKKRADLSISPLFDWLAAIEIYVKERKDLWLRCRVARNFPLPALSIRGLRRPRHR